MNARKGASSSSLGRVAHHSIPPTCAGLNVSLCGWPFSWHHPPLCAVQAYTGLAPFVRNGADGALCMNELFRAHVATDAGWLPSLARR